MQISGYLLPPPLPTNRQSANSENDSRAQQFPDTYSKARRQPREYTFEGEILDDATTQNTGKNVYTQVIDPANRNAISSYTAQQSSEASKGQLLDIFI